MILIRGINFKFLLNNKLQTKKIHEEEEKPICQYLNFS